jgi:hypothetical protein
MLRVSRAFRWVGAAVAAVLWLGASSPAQAQTCSIRIEIVKAGFIVGVQGGGGTLTCGGKRYRLNIGGVSLGATIGASKAVLVGSASNVGRPSDVAGVYGAAEAGVAVVSGAKTARLRNPNGVVLSLRGHQVGLEFALDLSGMTLALR